MMMMTMIIMMMMRARTLEVYLFRILQEVEEDSSFYSFLRRVCVCTLCSNDRLKRKEGRRQEKEKEKRKKPHGEYDPCPDIHNSQSQ